MKKINWKILNMAFWIEVILAYLLPFKVTDGFCYQVGFPIPFLWVYDTKFGINPFGSMLLNPLGLLFNGIIIYLMLLGCVKYYEKIKYKQAR